MTSPSHRLERLLKLARRAQAGSASSTSSDSTSDPAPIAAPPGFATRVAARWANAPRAPTLADAWERVSWWGSALAVAACLLVFALWPAAPEPSALDLLVLGMPEQESPF